ncbi:hypothetical protein RINTHH_6110 [Richelia intracellularis HH01]|uniref:Uncharacterized protein n=1 Tax=Richelia intracellularis HH01 TaxID=1165094 RepID=M1X4V8_9NOST|nr:hypothetical protein RINTHH_6110 [Richelia intracellularis HH01]
MLEEHFCSVNTTLDNVISYMIAITPIKLCMTEVKIPLSS